MVEEGKGDSQGVVYSQTNKEMSSPFSKASPLSDQGVHFFCCDRHRNLLGESVKKFENCEFDHPKS